MTNHLSQNRAYETDFDNYMPATIYFGPAAMMQLCEHMMLEGYRFVSVMIGGRSSSLLNGAFNKFNNMSMSYDLDTPVYRNIPPEPTVEDVRAIVKHLEQKQPDAVVAIGGGSVLDAAKAAYLSWQTGMDVQDLFGVNRASTAFPGKKFKRVLCIPTTAGTGSEVTQYSNLVDPVAGVKRIIVEKEMVPEFAFVDPEYTMSAPRALTLTTALDALTHAVESILNTKSADADPASERWGLEAVSLIVKALPIALAHGDSLSAREKLSAAATLGGMCIQCRPTGLPHLCSFSFYGKVPHGIAVSALLPCFWRFYLAEEAVRGATMKLKDLFPSGTPQTTPESVVDAYEAFFASVTGYSKLGDLPGFDSDMIAKIASAAGENVVKLQTAPRAIAPEEAGKVLTEILSAAL